MTLNLNQLDRRRFLRGSGTALALPLLSSSMPRLAANSDGKTNPKRLACIYFPDGVPMPLREDPAYQDWSWFPHGGGTEFTFTKCTDVFEPLRDDLTVLSGFSHPEARKVHGHRNADQFLTAAKIRREGAYQNSISLDQVYAEYIGDQTRFSSLVMSTDGGIGTPRAAQTLSFSRTGRAIPAEQSPKRIFDMLFVKSNADAARRLAKNESALDEMLEDASDLRGMLSSNDKLRFDEYLDSVREAEIRVRKAKEWVNRPLPTVDRAKIEADISPDSPRMYVQTMLDMIYLAFKTDSTRVATYQIGRENGAGVSDRLARAVGFNLAHKLTHDTKNPGGWKNLGKYCRFLNEEFARFTTRLKETPEPAGTGSMLDNSLLLFGSASSAFHLSRNYPLVLAGGRNLGFQHGRYLNYAGADPISGAWRGGPEPYTKEIKQEDQPLTRVFVTMLQQLGMETDRFAGATGNFPELLA
ncbi:secreted protein containing DUF1552 [Rhodopirellula islandica]|uniref:Secreted protein containing DUF1552 n=1 Tax=Rhodopirellula islandica TaxID=595434 RepID=A0A0J1BK18_RHOIS|nr:DUF1552 domain-containing protein [Rhodopirellula islandica]KLU06763.1 secreted protein containing DUF1552 [Rhodopirellula islandica]